MRYFKISLFVLLFQSVFSLQSMQPDSLFSMATNKYIGSHKKNNPLDFPIKITEELKSDKVPIEVVFEIVRSLESDMDNAVLIHHLLQVKKFESLHSKMLDRMMAMRISAKMAASHLYFMILLKQNPTNKALASLVIEKYSLKCAEIADMLVSSDEGAPYLEKLIREFGFNVNIIYGEYNRNSRNTLLHKAVLSNSYACTEILLRNGALPNLKNITGETPSDLAIATKNDRLIHLLKPYSAPQRVKRNGKSNKRLEDPINNDLKLDKRMKHQEDIVSETALSLLDLQSAVCSKQN